MNSFLEFKHKFDAAGGSRGQVIMEYFVIFAVLAAITLVGLTQFDEKIRATMENFLRAAANNMTQ